MNVLVLIGTEEVKRFASTLSALLIPIVVFTIKKPIAVEAVAKVLAYVLLLSLPLILLMRRFAKNLSFVLVV